MQPMLSSYARKTEYALIKLMSFPTAMIQMCYVVFILYLMIFKYALIDLLIKPCASVIIVANVILLFRQSAVHHHWIVI